MTKFKVEISREIKRTFWQTGEIIVEAESGDEAEQMFVDGDFEELTKDAKWNEEEEIEKIITEYGVENVDDEGTVDFMGLKLSPKAAKFAEECQSGNQ